jgi:hypothetical protein
MAMAIDANVHRFTKAAFERMRSVSETVWTGTS